MRVIVRIFSPKRHNRKRWSTTYAGVNKCKHIHTGTRARSGLLLCWCKHAQACMRSELLYSQRICASVLASVHHAREVCGIFAVQCERMRAPYIARVRRTVSTVYTRRRFVMAE